jgi:hypothetical protein
MNRKIGLALASVLALSAVAAIVLVGSADQSVASVQDAKDPCCFTNPRFSGVCKVTPGEDETCASILAYLNNPNSTGKAYCGGTTVRGGWSQVDCEE